MIVVIDPGHGGEEDRGACYGNLVEAMYCLDVAERLEHAIKHIHWDVYVALTRREDRHISLPARGQTSDRLSADLVISLHVNAHPGAPHLKGAMGFGWPGNDNAADIGRTILNAMPAPLKRTNSWHATDTEQPWLQRPRNVLRPHRATSVLIEVGFASNDEDRDYLLRDSTPAGLVCALLCGVHRAHDIWQQETRL